VMSQQHHGNRATNAYQQCMRRRNSVIWNYVVTYTWKKTTFKDMERRKQGHYKLCWVTYLV